VKHTIVSLYLVVVLSVPSIFAQQQTYSVGTGPLGVAFDGSNIWVANSGDNSVTKLLASTGAVVGTFSVGSNPANAAFDGTTIWVTNDNVTTVTQLLASTGALAGTYSVGSNPWGVTFDGSNIWVTNAGSNTVTKIPDRPPCNYNIVSTDNAGNFGFTAPVLNPGPNPALPNINSASVHQTIPLQVTATDCHGNPATNLTLAPSGTVVLTAANANVCTVDNPDNSISIDSAGNSGWQNLGGGIYQYNWKPLPPKGACLSFLLNLGDGIQHIAYFQFK